MHVSWMLLYERIWKIESIKILANKSISKGTGFGYVGEAGQSSI